MPLDAPTMLRPFRMETDLETVGEIMNECWAYFAEPVRTTLEEVRHLWETTPNFDPSQDAVVAVRDNQTVGFAVGFWLDEHDGPRIYRHEGHVHPDWLRLGIGTELLRWLKAHIEEWDRAFKVRPAEMRTLGNDFDLGLPMLLGVAGYRRAASHMILLRPNLRDIADAPLPAGIEIRPVTEAQYRQIYAADIEAFQDHRGFGDTGEAGYLRFREDPYFDPSLWKIAWEGDEVVGQVRTFVDQPANDALGVKRAWTEDISVRRPWRGRGIARTLICESLRELSRRGYEEAALNVHTENVTGPFYLYTDLGYEVVSTFTEWSRKLR